MWRKDPEYALSLFVYGLLLIFGICLPIGLALKAGKFP